MSVFKFEKRSAVRVKEAKSYFLSFPYDKKMVELIKETPTHYWNPETKEWELSERSFEMLNTRLRALSPQQKIDFHPEDCSNNKALKVDWSLINGKPFKHQKEYIEYVKNRTGVINSLDQGLGKTFCVAAQAVMRKKTFGDKHCLIITCVNGLKYNWQEELEKFTNEKAYIIGSRLTKNGLEKLGGNKEKMEDLLFKKSSFNYETMKNSFFWIINIEALRYKGDTTKNGGRGKYILAEAIQRLCDNKTIGMVTIDEIHKSSNYAAKQTKGLLKIRPACKVAMTGTLITNSPLNAWLSLYWLGVYRKTYFHFEKDFAIKGGFAGREIVGYKNLEELNKMVHSCMFRRMKDDVLDLPEKIHSIEYIELSAEEKKLYKLILEEAIQEINDLAKKKGGLNVQNALTKLLRLRQVTSNANILFPDFEHSSKFERCKDLVREAVQNGEKVVIFSQFTSITNRLFDELKEFKPLLYTGEVDLKERQAIINKFQNEKDNKVFIGTAGAAGTGITITAASTCILIDLPWTKALKSQLEDRIYRIGQNKRVNIIDLVAKGTIDEYIYKIVESKGELSSMVVDNTSVNNLPLMMNWLLEQVEM